MNQDRPKLEWSRDYSVGVVEIDEQHKKLFAIINELIDRVDRPFEKADIIRVIDSLLEYKKFHFATEEKYFEEFNYEGAVEHIKEHRQFEEDLIKIKEKNKDDISALAFELIDFIEDWLVTHLMTTDQKYVQCFKEHGLK